MFRVILLFGFGFYLMFLHISGNISQYINMKYAYLSFSSMFAAFLLALIQLVLIFRDEDLKETNHNHCGHTHDRENTIWKKVFVYSLLIYPLLAGFMFPIAELNSKIVTAKGFHFPKNNAAGDDPYAQNQFLKPDTSGYFGKTDYEKMIMKEKKELLSKKQVIINDENYLMAMEILYHYPGEFTGKEIQFTGFVYNDPVTKDNHLFLFRFGIIHCVADSGVFGILVQMPKELHFANDTWLTVRGLMNKAYYAPFKMSIPMLEVSSYQKIEKPKDVYVYRKY